MLIDIKEIQKLVRDGLVSEKTFSDYPDLRMYKYKNKVFFKNLWNESEMLRECRGLVLDTSGNIVALPFKKVFNYKENGTTIRKNSVVKTVEKKNGFFAACSLYKDEVLVSTTGSLDSDFTQYAKEMLNLDAVRDGLIALQHEMGWKGTMMFEICHPKDPHIVEEEFGAYLIGFRLHGSGMLVPEEILDRMAIASNTVYGEGTFLRPHHFYTTFGNVLKHLKGCKDEGYMVYKKGSEKALKLKSPHYLSKKFIMRMGEGKIGAMFKNTESFVKGLDEELVGIVYFITNNFDLESWSSLNDQQRRKEIEQFFSSGAFRPS